MKVLLPAAWITGFGIGCWGLRFGTLHLRGGGSPAAETLIAWIAGIAFLWWGCVPLKEVDLAGDTLRVSNYLRELTVPVTEIESVSENRWININAVTIRFRHPTAFGDSIVFMPKSRPFAFFSFSPHPVIEQLERRVASARQANAKGR